MEDNRIIVGLDIGTDKIVAIVGKKNEYGKLEILGIGQAKSEGVVRGTVTNIDKTVVAIKEAIHEAEESANIDIKIVNVGVAGKHISSSIHHGGITRESHGEEITIEDVKKLTQDMYRIVMLPGNEIIHVMPQDYSVDYERGIKDPVGMTGVKLEGTFHIITANTNAVKNIYKCVKRAGLEVENLILEPLASSMAVLSDEEKEAGVCLVDLGSGTADIAIFHDAIIRHTAVIPFGGQSITSDIKYGCKIMEPQAEQLKVRFGRAIADGIPGNEVITIPGLRERPPKEVGVLTLAKIIEARMEEIIEHIHAEIIASDLQHKLAGGIVITGGAAQLRDTQQLFEDITDLDTRLGYPNEYLGKGHTEIIKNPIFSTGIGLVLAGFKALDFRDDYYRNSQKLTTNSFKPNARKEKKSGAFLSRMLEKTKGLLIDDYDSE